MEILSNLLALIGTMLGTFGGILTANKLSNYRIEQLEKKVEAHNCLIDRVYKLEQRAAVTDEDKKVINHRIADLEQEIRSLI
ncbi:MAG: hypothetical protein IJN65_05755 [Clostridia bacterium]|nr:hypothetical protein [Clostridia bacterium]